jgi:hypothetical protein
MCKSTKDKNTAAPGAESAVDTPPAPPAPVIQIKTSVTRYKKFPNPLNDPAQATTLLQKNNGIATADAFNAEREYSIFVPPKLATAFFNAPAGSKPAAKVSIFLGVGPELTLFRLREFFAKETNSVIIVGPGVESGDGWPGINTPFGVGISTDIINKLMTAAGLDGIDFTVEVMAGYSTGYRGLNLTIINKLVDLSHLKRMIYLDAWYHHDDHPLMPGPPYKGKNTLFAIDTAFIANPNVQVVIYAFTTGGVPRTVPNQGNHLIPDPPREPVDSLITKYPGHINFIDFEYKFSKPAIGDELTKICIARLIKLGIGGKFQDSAVVSPSKALVDALPERGSLGVLGLAGYTDLYGWITANNAAISSFQIPAGMKMVTTFDLLDPWTVASFYEMRHRMFVIELGKEALVP